MLAENNENRNCGCSCPMNNNSNMIINNGEQNPMAMSAAIGMDTDGCNCCCEKKPTPSIPMYHYHFTNVEPEEFPIKEETREEMIQNIRCLSFAVVELAEYLDTHVDDEKALCLHREYATKLHELKEKYQKVYGPLTINFPCNKWRWIEEPWPWERGNF
ncbi:MAG: spore coat protein CotJB [Clostridia bacterium]|nr:spore coat protein CotJB [Clostridia bacterium]